MFCYREDILHSTVTILHARVALQSRVRNLGNLCSWNPESWVLETGIQLKESGIPLTIGIQNPSSTDKYWNPVPGIRNPRCGIQNTRLSQIPLHRAICLVNGKPLKPPPPLPPRSPPPPWAKLPLFTVRLPKKQTPSDGSNWKFFNFPTWSMTTIRKQCLPFLKYVKFKH